MRRWHVMAKLGNMRKEAEFIVYPRPTNVGDDYNLMMIQSDHRICQFDATTGEGLLSKHCANHAGSVHLHPALGAMKVTLPKDLLDAVKAAQPQSGERQGVLVIG